MIRSFGDVASTGYGIGELLSLVENKDDKMVSIPQLTIPYIIADINTLHLFFFKKGIINILLDLVFISEPKKEQSLYAVNALTMIAINLDICYGQLKIQNANRCVGHASFNHNITENYVTFILKNNAQLNFNKNILSIHSDVFKRMFNSEFREARESTVKLTNISLIAMQCFLQTLVDFKSCSYDCTYLNKLLISELLELYCLSKMYLLPHLENLYLSRIQRSLSHKNVHIVVEWSFQNHDEELLHSSVLYCLSCDIESSLKLNIFRKLSHIGIKDHLKLCLKEFIRKKLKIPVQ